MDHDETIMAKGYGAALALPIWCQVMGKASAQRYPAKEFQPPEPLKRVRVCAFSNELATDGCEAAGTAYTHRPARQPRARSWPARPTAAAVLTPGAGVPLAPGQTPPPEPQDQSQQQKEAFPKRFLRSFRRLFGGMRGGVEMRVAGWHAAFKPLPSVDCVPAPSAGMTGVFEFMAHPAVFCLANPFCFKKSDGGSRFPARRSEENVYRKADMRYFPVPCLPAHGAAALPPCR